MSGWENRGAKAAQAEAAVQMLVAALDKLNPAERTISARLREAKQAMADYGDKHFSLLHRVKDNAEQVRDLKETDAVIRNSFHEAEGKAEVILERLQIASRPAEPPPEARIAMAAQTSLGQKSATIDRLAPFILHLQTSEGSSFWNTGQVKSTEIRGKTGPIKNYFKTRKVQNSLLQNISSRGGDKVSILNAPLPIRLHIFAQCPLL